MSGNVLSKIVFLLTTAVVVGCATQPVTLGNAQAQSGSPMFATLSDAGDPVDMAAAPVVNGLAATNYRILSLLRTGKISKAQAMAYQSRTRGLAADIRTAQAKQDMTGIRSAAMSLGLFVTELEGIK